MFTQKSSCLRSTYAFFRYLVKTYVHSSFHEGENEKKGSRYYCCSRRDTEGKARQTHISINSSVHELSPILRKEEMSDSQNIGSTPGIYPLSPGRTDGWSVFPPRPRKTMIVLLRLTVTLMIMVIIILIVVTVVIIISSKI